MNRNSALSKNILEVTPVAAQTASDLFENKEKRAMCYYMIIFDAVIGRIRG